MRFLYSALIVFFLINNISAQSDPWPWKDQGDNITSILIMGDTNIQQREDPATVYKYVMSTLKAADLRLLNLEGPFAGSSADPLIKDIPHKIWKHSEPDQVQGLVAAGIDAVGVANNVTYPWQALMRSLAVLEKAGIPYTGGGENLKAAHQPVILEKKGLRVGFMQYAATVFPYNHAATENRPGVAQIKVHTAYQPPPNLDKPGQPPIVITWLDEKSKALMLEDIRQLKRKCDFVIVSYHWGVSGTKEPVSYQTDIARAVIDAGADLVFGHGPHRYQKIELYKGKPILYSLAQFVFDDPTEGYRWKRNREGLLVRVSIENKKMKGVSLVPSWLGDDKQVRLHDPNEGKGRELFGYLQSVNENGVELKLEAKEIVIKGL